MKDFVYQYPVKVYFGDKTEEAIQAELKDYQRILLAYGGQSLKKTGVYDEIMSYLKDKEVIEFPGIMPNPTYEKVQEGARLVRDNHIDYILAAGGGSVIDCCKIVSAQALLDEDIWDLEYEKHTFPTNFISMGAIVTASGTGAEMNNGAVITHEEKALKSALFGAYASFALLNPRYTLTVPMSQVISGAFDTLSHAMETYFGKNTSVSDDISIAIMKNTIKNIRNTINNPDDITYRSELMWDSAMAENGILKLGKITDFQCHMIEHQLGAYTDCNHGQGLAVIHPVLYRHIYKENIPAFARFGREVWGITDDNDSEAALKGIEALASFIKEIGLPTTFEEMGITDTEILKKVADTSIITGGCCKQLSREEIYEILKECMK